MPSCHVVQSSEGDQVATINANSADELQAEIAQEIATPASSVAHGRPPDGRPALLPGVVSCSSDVQRCPAHSCFHHVQDDHELGAEHDGQCDPATRRGRAGPPVARTDPVNPADLSGIISPIRSMRRTRCLHGYLVMRFDGRDGPSMRTRQAWLVHLGRPSRSGLSRSGLSRSGLS